MIRLPALLGDRSARIAPGRIILVVGPSGAGKDRLLTGARELLAGDSTYIFPRRVVTRAATEFEDHESIGDEAFDSAVAAGEFAFWWSAHGLRYGIPASADAEIRKGRCVICNTSRAIIPELRNRYSRTVVVLVTAPEKILTARLSARGRTSDGENAERIGRARLFADTLCPDFIIENIGRPEVGIEALSAIVCGRRALAEFAAELLF
jgi:ribose 1,5-bisphosphokinase